MTDAPDAAGATPIPRVRWDDSRMTSTFANVVNVLGTREEMSLLFGSNQTWNLAEAGELVVQLSHRIVLTPFAAKRLMMLLEARVREHESRHGVLEI